MAFQSKKLINDPNGNSFPMEPMFVSTSHLSSELLCLKLDTFTEFLNSTWMVTDVVTEFIEGLVETYPGLQYLDGFPEVRLVFMELC